MTDRKQIMETIQELEKANVLDIFDCLEPDETKDEIGQKIYNLKSEGYLEIDQERCYSLTAKGIVYMAGDQESQTQQQDTTAPPDSSPSNPKTTAKQTILSTLSKLGPATSPELSTKANTGQTSSAFSNMLWALHKSQGLIQRDPQTRRYSLTESGKAWLNTGGSKPGHEQASTTVSVPDKPTNGKTPGWNGGKYPNQAQEKKASKSKSAAAKIPALPGPAKQINNHDQKPPVIEENAFMELVTKALQKLGFKKRTQSFDDVRPGPPHPSGVQPLEVSKHESFCAGMAIALLLARHNHPNPLETLKNAAFYLDEEIKHQETIKGQER